MFDLNSFSFSEPNKIDWRICGKLGQYGTDENSPDHIKNKQRQLMWTYFSQLVTNTLLVKGNKLTSEAVN